MRFSHTFSICAYKESPYLEACIRSLKGQSLKTRVIICTSTPNEYIKNLAEKYELPLFIREGKSGIKEDWNFAYNSAETAYVTVAHQDDVYDPDYAITLERLVIRRGRKFSMAYTGYRPLKNGKVCSDINCRIRAFLRVPMKFYFLSERRWARKATLSLGNSICCPSVMYNKTLLGDNIFTSDMKFNIDWDTFLKLAEKDLPFLYTSKTLTYYRIHDGATSKTFIDNNNRRKEDTDMFRKFWGRRITNLIMHFYVKAYETYQ
ncbi:MAG: glycosyltransferase [Lachnospiraceae bacterium]